MAAAAFQMPFFGSSDKLEMERRAGVAVPSRSHSRNHSRNSSPNSRSSRNHSRSVSFSKGEGAKGEGVQVDDFGGVRPNRLVESEPEAEASALEEAAKAR